MMNRPIGLKNKRKKESQETVPKANVERTDPDRGKSESILSARIFLI